MLLRCGVGEEFCPQGQTSSDQGICVRANVIINHSWQTEAIICWPHNEKKVSDKRNNTRHRREGQEEKRIQEIDEWTE